MSTAKPHAGNLPARITEAHTVLAYQVLPIIRAAQHLANCRRVLDELSISASIGSEDGDALDRMCPTWRDPFEQDGHDLVQDLMRLAERLLTPTANDMDRLSVDVNQALRAHRGEEGQP